MTKRKNERRAKQNPLSIIMLIILVAYTISLLGILFWGVMTSFKGTLDFMDHPYEFPEKIEWNCIKIIKEFKLPNVLYPNGEESRTVGFLQMFGYSFLYAIGCGIVATIVPCVVGYLCAMYPFKLSKIVYSVVVVCMIVPTVGNLPSELEMTVNLGLYNHFYGMWILKANFLGLYFLTFYSTFKCFPKSYMEAAKIDGASNMRVLLEIAMPLVANIIGTVFLINFINFWNDYQTPLLYMPAYPTIAQGLFKITNGTVIASLNNLPSKLAAAFFVVIPTLILFILFQKKLMGNLTVGGIK